MSRLDEIKSRIDNYGHEIVRPALMVQDIRWLLSVVAQFQENECEMIAQLFDQDARIEWLRGIVASRDFEIKGKDRMITRLSGLAKRWESKHAHRENWIRALRGDRANLKRELREARAEVERWKGLAVHHESVSDEAKMNLLIERSKTDKYLEHSKIANKLAWRIAEIVGDVPEGADRIQGDPFEQLDRLEAKITHLQEDIESHGFYISARYRKTVKGLEQIEGALQEARQSLFESAVPYSAKSSEEAQ